MKISIFLFVSITIITIPFIFKNVDGSVSKEIGFEKLSLIENSIFEQTGMFVTIY
jgi:hypothetical protein